MTFIHQGSFHINSCDITGHQRTVTVSEIHQTLFIWSQRPCCITQIFDRIETILFVKNCPRGCAELSDYYVQWFDVHLKADQKPAQPSTQCQSWNRHAREKSVAKMAKDKTKQSKIYTFTPSRVVATAATSPSVSVIRVWLRATSTHHQYSTLRYKKHLVVSLLSECRHTRQCP